MKSQKDVPLVTIRCLVYNHEPYLRQCLDGFVMQKTNFRFEAIVHDDASTDGSADIIREYAAKYPDIIKPIIETENQYSKRDGSLGRIMNAHTHGKYVALCEGDDYWIDPLKLQKQVDFLESNSDYVMTYSDAIVVDGNSKPIFHRAPRRYSGNITKELLNKGNFIRTASACFRNRYEEYSIEREKIPFKLMMADLPMWIYYSTIGKVHCFDEKMVAYRVLLESASHFSDKSKLIAFYANAEQITKYFNLRYNVGLSEEDIEHRCDVSRVRAMATISRQEFVSHWITLIKKRKRVLFNIRLNIIAFIRIVCNRRV